MTVLRSRKVQSAVGVKTSKPSAGENTVVEPETPSKTSEFTSPSAKMATPASSGCPGQELGLGLREVVDSETGSARRRSARLAGKLDNGEEASGKRMKFEEVDFGKQEPDLYLGSDGGAAESGAVKEEVEKGESVSRLGLAGTADGGSGRKRKLSSEAKSPRFVSNEVVELVNKVMSLRSGKRVVIDVKEGSSGSDRAEKTGNSNKSVFVGSGNHPSVPKLEKGPGEDENGPQKKEKRFSRAQKGKEKVGDETLETSDSSMSSGSETEDVSGVKTRGRLSKEEKGKAKLGVNASSQIDINIAETNAENVEGRSASGASNHSAANEALPAEQAQAREAFNFVNNAGNVPNAGIAGFVRNRRYDRERHRNFARQNASRFAHFSSQDELGPDQATNGAGNSNQPQNPVEDWPGPFSTAMKIISDRATYVWSAVPDTSEAVEINWTPKKKDSCKNEKRAPSLQDLCLTVVSKNADAVTSLDFVPDSLRHKISWFLCDSRVMNGKFLELLVDGSPTEVRVRDCSWLTEELFAKIFEGLDASKLMVFQFDLCGSCMPDYNLHATLARSPNWLPALSMISLRGAYRLTDVGLSLLASAAPCLKSIDISQCPLLTSEGICCLLSSLRLVLRELYLDNCHGIDAMLILPALLKLESLEVLSLAGIQTVSDDFVSKFITASGCRMKELVLADCLELTDFSLEVIGNICSELRAIDLSNLRKLTDASIAHLANGCRTIEILKLCRNGFSDIAIAAYLDVRGASLKDLSLNNIVQVSGHTALALSRNCINIRSLDLSWCRNLTNEALGLIVDSCSLLEVLKLFGCSQITNVFVNGHSNRQVKLVGLKMTPLIKHIDVPDFLQAPLRYSAITP
ncbi:F-box/LRR-repeat protein 2 [Striga asiatica]|uniref:F-box/LRR-repeat protein 2 n=1 Tax=Striga asiatica TaxID=4170 RepID=A0A5A7PTA3_STRAF|nr:F-box/LRR-repeat protein 2 [Striga asiatica]